MKLTNNDSPVVNTANTHIIRILIFFNPTRLTSIVNVYCRFKCTKLIMLLKINKSLRKRIKLLTVAFVINFDQLSFNAHTKFRALNQISFWSFQPKTLINQKNYSFAALIFRVGLPDFYFCTKNTMKILRR